MKLKLRVLAFGLAFTLFQITAHADDLNQVCGSDTASSQKGQYCSAAKTASKASKNDGTLAKIYAGVTAVCTVACALDYTPEPSRTMDIACGAGGLAAGATDLIMTKNFMSAIGLAGSGYSLYSTLKAPAGTATTAYVSPETDIPLAGKVKTSCITAGMSAMSTFTHYQSSKNENQTAKNNLASAKAVTDTTQSYTINGSSQPSNASSASSGSSTPQNIANTSHPAAGSGDSCSGVSSLSGAVQCLANSDAATAKRLADPHFAEAFQQASGTSFDEFLKAADGASPSQAISAAMGGALTPSGIEQTQAALAKLEGEKFDFDTPGSSYAGGIGGNRGSAGNEFASAMKGLMEQFAPKSDAKVPSGVTQTQFNTAKRSLASVSPEDRSVSLFDRVTYRYSSVSPKLLLESKVLSDWTTVKKN